uniref:Uncharacterized transposon-derived protein F54H12.3 n=1 Tax=Anoplophora glabripennis TaxID=217634 RepID=V5GT36_ANOGL
MKKIFRDAGYFPRNLQSDHGLEFYNRQFSKLMQLHKINHYSTFSTKKAAIVERTIRTLKTWIYKEFSARGNYVWIDILPKIISSYNNRVHRTTGMKPIDVKPSTVLKVYNHPKVALKPKFSFGDIVRISKFKNIFQKGFTANFSTELFKVIKVNITNPTTYALEDMQGQPIKGCFYEWELLKTKYPNVYLVQSILKKKKKNNKTLFFCKWLGLPASQNSWINKADFV